MEYHIPPSTKSCEVTPSKWFLGLLLAIICIDIYWEDSGYWGVGVLTKTMLYSSHKALQGASNYRHI